MILLTKEAAIASVADHWFQAYRKRASPHEPWGWTADDKRQIHVALCELVNPTEDAIAAIIGNRSWTRLVCDECRRDVDAVIAVGGHSEYESPTVYICASCLLKAAALMPSKAINET